MKRVGGGEGDKGGEEGVKINKMENCRKKKWRRGRGE